MKSKILFFFMLFVSMFFVSGSQAAEVLGVNGVVVSRPGGTGDVLFTFDPIQVVGSQTWGDGSTDTIPWTWDVLTGTNPTMSFSNALITIGGGLNLTGPIGVTGTRVSKGWFTDLTVTNSIDASITGSSNSVEVTPTTDDTTWVMLATSTDPGGEIVAPATDDGIQYNATTNVLSTTATTATNIAGGAAGSIWYQDGAGSTVELAAPVVDSILGFDPTLDGGDGEPFWITDIVSGSEVEEKQDIRPLWGFNITNPTTDNVDIRSPLNEAWTITSYKIGVTGGTSVALTLLNVNEDATFTTSATLDSDTFTTGPTEVLAAAMTSTTLAINQWIEADITAVTGSVTGLSVTVFGYKTAL